MDLAKFSKDKKANKWIELLDLSVGTKKTYFFYLKEFCNQVGKTPTELIDEAIAEIKDGKMPSERNCTDYLLSFKASIKEKTDAQSSINTAVAAIKSFYKAFDIQLSFGAGKLKRAPPQRENQNFLVKADVLKLIVNAKNLRDKAIFLVMATSGIARMEMIHMRIGDLTFDESGIGIIKVRRQKTNQDYTTFCSPEAVTSVKNYLDERNRTDKLKVKSNTDYLFVSYRNASVLNKEYYTQIFHDLGMQLGYANGDFFVKTRSHAFRKFFSCTLENAGVPKSKVDYLLGHARSGNDMAYFQPDFEVLKQLYLKYLPFLTFEKNIEVRSIDTKDEKRLAELEQQNEALKAKLESKDTETQDLKKRLDKLESALQSIIGAAAKK